MKNLNSRVVVSNKTLSSRERMNIACTYLASGNEGKGLDPVRVEQSINDIKDWKFDFIDWIIGKPVNGKNNVFFTRITATELADNMIKGYYEMEVRAFSEEPMGKWGQHRKLGDVEYGTSTEYSYWDMERPDYTNWLISKARWNTPDSRKEKLYGQLLVYLATGKRINTVLRNAATLYRVKAITKEQFTKLNSTATQMRKDRTVVPV